MGPISAPEVVRGGPCEVVRVVYVAVFWALSAAPEKTLCHLKKRVSS